MNLDLGWTDGALGLAGGGIRIGGADFIQEISTQQRRREREMKANDVRGEEHNFKMQTHVLSVGITCGMSRGPS